MAVRFTISSLGFTHWQDDDFWLGHLDEYPDYETQGTSREDLKVHLLNFYRALSASLIPAARRHVELGLLA